MPISRRPLGKPCRRAHRKVPMAANRKRQSCKKRPIAAPRSLGPANRFGGTPNPCSAKPHDGKPRRPLPEPLAGSSPDSAGRWQRRPHHHIHTRRSDAIAGQGVRKSSVPAGRSTPRLPDVLGYSDHRMPDIIASAKRTTRRPQTMANRVSAPSRSFFAKVSLDDD